VADGYGRVFVREHAAPVIGTVAEGAREACGFGLVDTANFEILLEDGLIWGLGYEWRRSY
jgi:hypothetical protein